MAPPARRIVIDCDPGIDDAIAILIALASPSLDLRGLTIVSGNVAVDAGLRNALALLELAGRAEIGVYRGCFRPLVEAPIRGRFHGTSGLGPVALPEPTAQASDTHAVDFLAGEVTAALRDGATLTICTLGPMTNLAVLLRTHEDLIPGIDRIVAMGGAFREPGNRTLTSEFNILADPHAAHIVFSAGIPMTLLPLDATHQAMATPERIAVLARIEGSVAETVAQLLAAWDRKDPRRFGSAGGPLHDPLVTAWLVASDLFGSEKASVFVEHESRLCLGQTVADWFGKSDRAPNVDIVTRADAAGFFALLADRLAWFASRVAPGRA